VMVKVALASFFVFACMMAYLGYLLITTLRAALP
jgi:hypothetical protein